MRCNRQGETVFSDGAVIEDGQRVRLQAVNNFFEIYNLGFLAEWARKIDRQIIIETGSLPTCLVVNR
ncbi:hypothetical protein SAMN05216360_104139 [Methylobacterium phyllostachyos]|uniref:Uncharacterized protein n=1 Tax=Methylobacterium phyllostachyos TaxID=582672 RepID=A0A1G9WV70_9HYPH|nr:hypothetical protein [Methylobacterium phyllostachyos]SDM88367.1 hypothetical protein SAMN05216360_104139 [Methylobacterium phyllostachyos]